MHLQRSIRLWIGSPAKDFRHQAGFRITIKVTEVELQHGRLMQTPTSSLLLGPKTGIDSGTPYAACEEKWSLRRACISV